jgi:DmsE family decaheme c-type cytochrome
VGNGNHRAIRNRISITAVLVASLLVAVAVSCRSPHQVTRRTEPNLDTSRPQGNPAGWPKADSPFVQVAYQAVKGTIPTVPGADYVNDDELCVSCHEAYTKTFAENVHRGDTCESCHGPASKHLETRGKEPGLIFGFKKGDPAARAEACLLCHEQNGCTEGAQWRRSRHAHCGVTCVDCHVAHYNVPAGTPATTEPATTTMTAPLPVIAVAADQVAADGDKAGDKGYVRPAKNLPSLRGTSHHLGAVSPGSCYRCHTDMRVFQEIAGPHQICGPNNFNCTTCHDPHGQIKEGTRKDLCLQCHSGTPTMAWHSSSHNLNGVACTDCHNPHPNTRVQQVVGISHTNVARPKRLMMSVQEPESCYKCHPKIFGLTSLPSHHPIKEGKMVCSDCHDAHGQREGNLKGENVNLLCYKCHAEKQGPFAYAHPPVTENCAICHEPHGTVANNLLKQPPTFLCLRCHSGHLNSHGPQANATNININTSIRRALYTNCTECHTRIHGSDIPMPHQSGAMMR